MIVIYVNFKAFKKNLNSKEKLALCKFFDVVGL